MNFKKILLGSAIFATTFGFIACGGDSSSGTEEDPIPVGPDVKPGDKIVLPEASSLNPIEFTGISLTPMASGTAGTQKIVISGLIKLIQDFDPNQAGATFDPATVNTQIDSVKFAVARSDDQLKQDISVPVDVAPERVSFSGNSFETSQLNGCGQFTLYVFVYSSTRDGIGTKPATYTTLFGDEPAELTAGTFTRAESECAAPVASSSSVAPVSSACTQVTANELQLSNSLGSSQVAINFTTGLADNPHVTVEFKDGVAMFTAGAGVTVVEDNYTQTTGLLPQGPVCRESFSPSATQAAGVELASGTWIDITGPDGILYPVMIKKTMMENDTKGTLTLYYFK